MLLVGLRDLQLLLGSRESGFGRFDLCRGGTVLGDGIVEFLFSDQAGTRVGSLLQSSSCCTQGNMIRFRAIYVVLSARYFLLAVAHARISSLQLRCKLWDLENSEHLALVDVIANVNIDVLDIAGDLGVEFHFLVREKFARNG